MREEISDINAAVSWKKGCTSTWCERIMSFSCFLSYFYLSYPLQSQNWIKKLGHWEDILKSLYQWELCYLMIAGIIRKC